MEGMASMKRPRLEGIEALPALRLRLRYVDGTVQLVDFTPLIEQSPGLAPLADPKIFEKASLVAGQGWAVVWPDQDIQVGADTLWLDAQAQAAADENTRVFAQWRARHNLSLAQDAEALGMTRRTISAYGTGARPVPRVVALACKGWEAQRFQPR
jgi:hypothetical protein